MTATVTNLTQIDAIGSASWINASVGGGTAIPGPLGEGTGIDGNLCFGTGNEDQPVTGGTYYSTWSGNLATAGNGYDITAIDSAVFLHARNPSGVGYTIIAENSDSIHLVLFSGGSSAEYAIWEYDGAIFNEGRIWHVLMAQGTANTETAGFDYTDITGVGLSIELSEDGAFGFQLNVDQALYFSGPLVFEDTGVPATVTLEDYYNLLIASSGTTYHNLLVKRAGTTFEFGFPIDIQSDDYNDTSQAIGIAFKAAEGLFPAMPVGYFGLILTGQASGSQIFENLTAATLSLDFYLTIDGSAASTSISISTLLASGLSDVSISGAGVTISNGSVISPSTCTLSDGDLELVISDCTAPIDWIADLIAGSNIITNSDMDITFAETDLSDINLEFTASNTVTVSPITGAGTYNLSGLTTLGTVNLDNATANDTTIVLTPGTSNTVESPTTGGGAITVDASVVVDLTVTVRDATDGSSVENARVRLEAGAGGPETPGVVLLEGLTNASGVLTTTYTYGGDQPVVGTVRKSSPGDTLYKPGQLGGTILSTGYNVPLTLVRD